MLGRTAACCERKEKKKSMDWMWSFAGSVTCWFYSLGFRVDSIGCSYLFWGLPASVDAVYDLIIFVFSLYPVSFVCMASPGTSSLIDVTSFHYPLSFSIIQRFYYIHYQCTQNCNWISQSKLYGIVIPHPNMIPLPTPLHMQTQHQD